MLQPFFWLLNDDGSYRVPLPDVESYTVSPIADSAGAVELKYPIAGLNFDLLREFVDDDTDALLAVWLNGAAAGSLRVLLDDGGGDEVAEDAVWTFSGRFQEARLDDAVVLYQGQPAEGEEAEVVFPSATPGTIMRTLLQQAQARGVLTDLDFSSFSTTHDSNGVPWPKTATRQYSPGTSLLTVAERLAKQGLSEFEVTKDLQLRLYVHGTRGQDLTVGSSPVRLQRGRDITEAPRRRAVRGAGTDLIVEGAGGIYRKVFSATARARRGRLIERFKSQGGIEDPGALQAYGAEELQRVEHGPMEQTLGLLMADGSPIPLQDFRTGDWLWCDVGRGLERFRVRQLTVSGGRDGLEATVSLNDLLADRDERLARRLDELEDGESIAGTSQVTPSAPDTKTPAAPTGLTVTSAAYIDADGATWAAAFASWLPVNTNADGTAADDIAGYRVQYRYLSGGSLPAGWIEVPPVSGASADWSGVVAEAAIEVRVAAEDRSSNVSAWSSPVALTAAGDATPPPVPSTPVVTSYLGILAVEWDGKGSAGEAMPRDFGEIEVHVSTTAGFTPDRPADMSTSTTYADSLRAAGTLPIAIGEYGQTFYVRLVSVDRSGNPSDPSAEDSAQLVQAGDGDVSALSIGKLTAGVMSALMTISGIIRTASSGARVELDAAGLRCYAADGRVLFEFNIPTSALSLLGRFTAGASATSGSRIILDPAYTGLDGTGSPLPTQLFYSSAGTFGPGFVNAFNEGSGRTGVGFNSGPSQSGSDYRKSVLVLRTDRAEMMLTNPDTLSRRGGRVLAAPDRAAVEGCDSSSGALRAEIFATGAGAAELKTYTSGGADRARIGVYSSGAIDLYGVLGAKLLLRADGSVLLGGPGNGWIDIHTSGQVQIVSQGAVKAFVIDHPTDPDRWLVHGCTESPHAGVEYWGTATIHAGRAVVELPTYFEAATRREGRAVLLTPLDPADGQTPPSAAPAAATYPVGGRFEIRAPLLPDGTRVAWLVKAIRADVPPLDAEPLRGDVDVHGDGPYRYITPKEGA